MSAGQFLGLLLLALMVAIFNIDRLGIPPVRISHDPQTLKAVANWSADVNDLDARLFTRQIQQESGWNPKAKSPCGAIGIAQIMPSTAKSWGVDPNDPVDALGGAAKYMGGRVRHYMHKGFSRRMAHRLALSDYNAGEGGKVGTEPKYKETRNYISAIMGN